MAEVARRVLWAALLFLLAAVAASVQRRRGAVEGTVFAIEAAIVWVAGSAGLTRSGIPFFIAWRLAAGFIASWSALLLARGSGPAAAGAAALAVASYLSSFDPALRGRLAQRLAPPGEVRIPLRIPFLLWNLTLTPVTFLTGFALGVPALVAAAGVTLAPLTIATAVIGAILAVPLAISSHRLEQRWLVIAPRGLVIHDPFMLSSTLRIPPETVECVEPAEDGWRWKEADNPTLLDLSAGAFSRPLLVRLRTRIEAPQPRHVGIGMAYPRAGYVTLVAVCPADPREAYRSLARAGYARHGEFVRLEASSGRAAKRRQRLKNWED